MTLSDAAPSLRKPANTNATSTLKLIALFFMIIDHAGKVLMNNQYEWRLLGRIAFPIYAWCLVVGVCYTHSVPKYARRLLITGLVSQPLYVIALNHPWPMFTKPNIFLTLLLGLFALWGMRDKKYGSQFWAPAIALCLATVLHADYDWRGVLLIILLFAVRDSRPGIAAVIRPALPLPAAGDLRPAFPALYPDPVLEVHAETALVQLHRLPGPSRSPDHPEVDLPGPGAGAAGHLRRLFLLTAPGLKMVDTNSIT